MKRLITFAVLLLTVQFCFATVHHVPATYTTIQSALNACSAGDTVLVAQGTYYENIIWPGTQSILLISESGAAETIIDGGANTRVVTINTGVDNTTIIDGFTIKNGYEDVGGGIGIAYSSPTIKNNIITQNIAYGIPANFGGGGGIAVGYSSSVVIVDNFFNLNSATASAGGGFSCAFNSNPIIHNNTFENNSAATGGGAIFIHDGCSAMITNNQVRYNTSQMRGGGMYFQNSSSTVKFNTIEYNIAETTGGGIEFGQPDITLIDDNTIANNTAHLSGGGVGIHNGSMPTISNNIISNNSANHHGGGIYCTENSNPLITNNQITGNEADSTGGGINCSYSSSPTVQYNTIDNNTSNAAGGGGICLSYGSSPLIKNNVITNCQANGNSGGGGILIVYSSSAVIENNQISSNSCDLGGGGILGYVGSSAYILGNTVTDNNAGGAGGGLCFQNTLSIVKFNKVMYNTSGTIYWEEGAGIWSAWSDQSIIDSNDILENYGDGIYCKEGATPLINWNNICGNTGYGVRNIDPGVTVNAEHNWWDHLSGPGGVGPGTGDSVSSYVDYEPWLTGPVPVELTSFTATCIAGEVVLNWTTATEVNNHGFEIERRIINKEAQGEWTLIGFREGYGTTTEPKEYSYTDNINGLAATSLVYRLKQIDYDGSIEYSNEVFIDNPAPVDFVLEQNYPNPFNPSTTISYSVPVKSHITLKVYNALGKEVITLINEEQSPGTYQIAFITMNLASGVYFYRLKAGDYACTNKMILMK